MKRILVLLTMWLAAVAAAQADPVRAGASHQVSRR